MKLIVGLGNPGKQYEKTRHNIGFMAIDNYVNKYKLNGREKFNGIFYTTTISGENFILLKPLSYMNLSGGVVRKFVEFYKIDLEDIYIICDDLDMPTAKLRLRANGSSGGHNGLKDIELNLRTQNYKRIKLGISNDKMRNTKDYVLGKFTNEEMEILKEPIDKISSIIDSLQNTDFLKLMNKYN